MKKRLLFFALFAAFILSKAQIISSSRWSDLFSYNNILAIKEDNGRLIAATENGIFYYNISSGEITKLSKANGLHEVKISAFDYNPETKIGLVGYKNGTMDVITPNGVTLVVDIPIANGFSGDKKINHISITGNQAVISVAYGVSIFNLDKKEFGDTCFFLSGSNYIASKEAVIKDNKVYAATASGLFSHAIDVTLPLFTTWSNVFAGDWSQIANGDKIYLSNNNALYSGDGASFMPFSSGFTSIKDISSSGTNVTITDDKSVKVFSSSGAH